MAQYMTVPIYAVAFVAVCFTGFFMDKFPHLRGLVIASWLTLALICSICVCAIYKFTARYVLLIFMAAGLWASNGLALSYAASTFGSMPQEVRAIALALVNALGNLAQIYGTFCDRQHFMRCLFANIWLTAIRRLPIPSIGCSEIPQRFRRGFWYVFLRCLCVPVGTHNSC